ncbi:MAG: endolytic transglycosylase MltG, partial [Actinobacteria bacterium]|nr:endolytic transglycosylase MltG [Actinomycetota bacterium]
AAPDAVRRIQPQPPAPPAAPAGVLHDETERPIGIRRVRRAPRPIVTPPGDTRAGPARRRRRSVGARLFGLLALAVLAVVVIAALMLFQPFGSAEGSQVQVTIPQGASAREIGDRLAAAGVVDSGLFFSVRATLSGKRESLRSGRHTLRQDMTYGKAIAALTGTEVSKEVPTVDVTIPEGRSRREIAPIAERAGLTGDYLKASARFKGALSPFRYGAPRGTRSLEGFLFPATYELLAGAPARDLVEKQLAAFRENFAKVDLERARRRNLTGYDVLIIASMVEREARVEKERPLIAAVIYNRLKDGMPLGIDATTRYVLNKPSGALKQSELEMDSPYNTRKRVGLPPTPIGNPGLSSLRAAAKPANVGYRYFVVKPGTCGEHAFSNTIEQFQQDSARYDAARAEAGGRSPTTC